MRRAMQNFGAGLGFDTAKHRFDGGARLRDRRLLDVCSPYRDSMGEMKCRQKGSLFRIARTRQFDRIAAEGEPRFGHFSIRAQHEGDEKAR